jgi:GxxExxY protein
MGTNSQTNFTENQLSRIILDAAFKVHTKTGPGLLETVYEVLLAHELRKQGLQSNAKSQSASVTRSSFLMKAFARTCWSRTR